MPCHPGICKVCGSPTHEIERQHPAGSPLSGRPIKIGKKLSAVVKAHFLLTSGSWATMTIHHGCAELTTPETLPQLWQKCLETARWEQDNRVKLGAAPLKPKQAEAIEKQLLRLASIVPLGICCIEGA